MSTSQPTAPSTNYPTVATNLQDGPDDVVIQRLESTVRAGFDAVNAGNLTPTSPLWQCLADDFRCIIDPATCRPCQRAKRHPPMASYERLLEQCPGNWFSIVDISASVYEAYGRRYAQVFVNSKSSDGPGPAARVCKKWFSVFGFECRGGGWVCVSEASLPGWSV